MENLNVLTNKRLSERISLLELAPDTYVNGEITDHRAELAEAVKRLSNDMVGSPAYHALVESYVSAIRALCDLQQHSSNRHIVKRLSHTIAGLTSSMALEILTPAEKQ